MSAFTECDNPFSVELDPLEQCLKSMCMCLCVHPAFLLNCECNSAGISQSGLSRAGDPEKEQTEMEEEKRGKESVKKEEV